MKFDLIDVFGNQLILMILVVTAGLLIGRVKFGKFAIGTSGALFVGLFIGSWVHRIAEDIIAAGRGASGYEAAQKLINQGIISSDFFNMFLILFVTAVGLLAAKDIAAVLKKYGFRFIILGLLVTFIGAASTYVFTIISDEYSPYEVAGVYTGALTSSPGLGAAVETAKRHAWDVSESKDLTEEQRKAFVADAEAGVGVGHAIGYPFGVLMVIFAINFIPKIFKMNMDEEKDKFQEEIKTMRTSVKTKEVPEGKFDMLTFMMVAFIGYMVGSININLGPFGYFSLGNTGGALIIALILGYIGKWKIFHFRMDSNALRVVQNLALVFFLSIVGLKYGYKVLETIKGPGLYLAFVSIVVAFVSMMAAFLIGRYILNLNWVMLSGAICGGMTSTPGLGRAG